MVFEPITSYSRVKRWEQSATETQLTERTFKLIPIRASLEFSLNGAKLSLNSGNSENLRDH